MHFRCAQGDVNPNVTDAKFQTPLHLAIANEHLKCASLLLTSKWRIVNLRLENILKDRPIDMARHGEKPFFHLLVLLTGKSPVMRINKKWILGECDIVCPEGCVYYTTGHFCLRIFLLLPGN